MILIWLLAFALVVVGLAGLVVPGLPGAPIVFLGLVVGAWAEDFAFVGWGTMLIICGLGILTYVADIGAASLGAEAFGGTRRALLGAALGGLVGVFFGLPGIFLGPFLGAVIAELSGRRSIGAAGAAGFGAMLGFLVGTVVKLALAVSMVGVFVVVRLSNFL